MGYFTLGCTVSYMNSKANMFLNWLKNLSYEFVQIYKFYY